MRTCKCTIVIHRKFDEKSQQNSSSKSLTKIVINHPWHLSLTYAWHPGVKKVQLDLCTMNFKSQMATGGSNAVDLSKLSPNQNTVLGMLTGLQSMWYGEWWVEVCKVAHYNFWILIHCLVYAGVMCKSINYPILCIKNTVQQGLPIPWKTPTKCWYICIAALNHQRRSHLTIIFDC